MPAKKHLVELTDAERNQLDRLTRKGQINARVMKRAQVLLKTAAGQSDPEIMAAVAVSRPCVERIRQRFTAGGLQRALYDAPRPGAARRLNGKQEARLIAEACSTAPDGHDHWTMQLLADRAVTLGLAEQLSRETVRRLLKKTRRSRGSSANGVFRR